jgi:hypothetical protein
MSKKSDLDHGAHNKAAFDHLYPKKEFVDWIITTAFYAALHYVDHKIFPIKYSEKGVQITFEDMDSYAVSAANRFSKDKHTCRLSLVKQKLPEIYFEFNWLYSNSSTARYHNYDFKNAESICVTAKKHLETIITSVTKKHP